MCDTHWQPQRALANLLKCSSCGVQHHSQHALLYSLFLHAGAANGQLLVLLQLLLITSTVLQLTSQCSS
jgi:hypothetical protein